MDIEVGEVALDTPKVLALEQGLDTWDSELDKMEQAVGRSDLALDMKALATDMKDQVLDTKGLKPDKKNRQEMHLARGNHQHHKCTGYPYRQIAAFLTERDFALPLETDFAFPLEMDSVSPLDPGL